MMSLAQEALEKLMKEGRRSISCPARITDSRTAYRFTRAQHEMYSMRCMPPAPVYYGPYNEVEV